MASPTGAVVRNDDDVLLDPGLHLDEDMVVMAGSQPTLTKLKTQQYPNGNQLKFQT